MPYKGSEKEKTDVATWVKNNPERVKANAARHRARHPERVSAQDAAKSKRWRTKNHAKVLDYAVTYRITHAPEIKVSRAAHRVAHTEEIHTYQKAYRTARPEVKRINESRRRARKNNAAINDLSAAQELELQHACGFRCSYCGKKFPANKLTVDHITPIAAHGNNTLHNVTVACKPCNSKKGKQAPLKPVQPLLLTIAAPRQTIEKKP